MYTDADPATVDFLRAMSLKTCLKTILPGEMFGSRYLRILLFSGSNRSCRAVGQVFPSGLRPVGSFAPVSLDTRPLRH